MNPLKPIINHQPLAVLSMILGLRIADLGITYLVTPDLGMEWNPLVSQFNLPWAGLLLSQGLLVTAIFYGYLTYQRRVQLPVKTPGLNLLGFTLRYFNGDEPDWRRRMFFIPDRAYLRAHLAFLGFIITVSAIKVSLFAILHNLLILVEYNAYLDFVLRFGHHYVLTVLLVIIATSAMLFFITEFLAYRANGLDKVGG